MAVFGAGRGQGKAPFSSGGGELPTVAGCGDSEAAVHEGETRDRSQPSVPATSIQLG